MAAFSSEQLNFFKLSTVVLDEFPVALRKVFVHMWDTLVVPRHGCKKWDDSVAVLNWFLSKEGGAKKVPTLNKPLKDWDCTALFSATLFARSFAMPDTSGNFSTLDKLYVQPCQLIRGAFHHSVLSPSGDQAETFALALDQLRLLRNALCHQSSTRTFDKTTFEQCLSLAKDAFDALGQDKSKIDEIGILGDDDFPTGRVSKLEDELKREKDVAIQFKQIEDHLVQIESGIKDFGSELKDVKSELTSVGSDVKEIKAYFKKQIQSTETRSSPKAQVRLHLDCEIVPTPEPQERQPQVEARKVVETSQEPQLLSQCPVTSQSESILLQQHDGLTACVGRPVHNQCDVITTQRVLNRIADRHLDMAPHTREVLSEFLVYMEKVRNVLVVDKGPGSLILTVECSSLQILDGLWEDYSSGHLDEVVQKLLVTEDVLQEFGLMEVKMSTTILEEEYLACRKFFLHFQESFKGEARGNEETFLEKVNLDVAEISHREGEAKRYENLKTVYKSRLKYGEAEEYLNKALKAVREEKAGCSFHLGTMYRSLDEYENAGECYSDALQIYNEIGDREGEATCYRKLGTVCLCRGEYNEADTYFNKALVVSREIGNRKGVATCYVNLGVAYQSHGDYEKAVEYYNKALVTNKEIGHREGEATCYTNLGVAYQSRGDYEKANEYYNKALGISKEIGHKEGEATCYTNLGVVCRFRGEYVKAKEYQDKALVINEEIGDRVGEARCYGNLGTAYQSRGEYEKAGEYYNKALVISKEIGDRVGEATCYRNLGVTYQSHGEYMYEKADEYYNKALVISKEIGDREGEATCYRSLGIVYQSCGDYKKAKECQDKALVISKKIGNSKRDSTCSANLGVVYQYRG